VFAALWAAGAFAWAKHYRVRPEPKAPEPSAAEVWAQTLGARGKLAGSSLVPLEKIPGGQKFTLRLSRGDHDSSDVFGMTRKIASLFGKAVTEVYPERFPDAREHEVMLTHLRRNTLENVREWPGDSIDPATGCAVIADYPDGRPAHFRFWSPRNGAEQSAVVGVKGSGKSYLFHLLLSIAVTSPVPVVPVVLDPQQGQSLPDWRGRVTYARGVPQCMAVLRAFEAGMTARSDYLADLAWTGEDGIERPGMDFYDPQMSGLPLIFGIQDEAHLVLSDPAFGVEAVRIAGNLAKLNRKAGGHLMLASHTLLLTQLGDQTLRAMLIGGNVVALRTGENMSGGTIGLGADPHQLPRIFANGTETHGLGYLVGPDQRPDSPMRVRLVPNPRKVATEADIAPMDPVFGDAFRGSLIVQAQHGFAGAAEMCESLGLTVPAAAPGGTAPAAPPDAPALVPDAADPGGQTAADAILAVLTRPMERGEILEAVERKRLEWGREKPWTIRAVTGPLRQMTEAGRIAQPGGDGTAYSPVRPPLSLVDRTGS
jgi:hypothetical protein